MRSIKRLILFRGAATATGANQLSIAPRLLGHWHCKDNSHGTATDYFLLPLCDLTCRLLAQIASDKCGSH